MIEISVTDEFRRRYQELPVVIKNKAVRKESIFRQNPFHASLQTEKLSPKQREVWSFRIDREYRIVFRFTSSNNILFLTCGHHHFVYRYRF